MNKTYLYYIVAVSAALIAGICEISYLTVLAKVISDIFIKIFKCISMPVVSLSVIVALSCYVKTGNIWKKTLLYTTFTTLLAATVSAVTYKFLSPQNVSCTTSSVKDIPHTTSYWQYVLDIIPDSITNAFIQHKVLSVLLISIVFSIAIRSIPNEEIKKTLINVLQGLHSIFFSITSLLVKVLPIGLFGFITISIQEINNGISMQYMGKYFLVIICSNLIHGLVILPIWLMCKGINPIKAFKAMCPALSIAFFAKSSTGALPITIQTMESNLNVHPQISRFVLPLCTTINMNGCAAFIFSTVIYIMQNHGINIDFFTIITWIIISTIAAIGNAGIPMGCFFLSASLLSSMNVPISLFGLILPIYSVLDMLETALNVWSDSCVTVAINKGTQQQTNA